MPTRAEIIGLVKEGKMEREDAAKELHLTPARIGQLLKELDEKGTVTEAKGNGKEPEAAKAPEGEGNHPYMKKTAPMPKALTIIPGQGSEVKPVAQKSLRELVDGARGGGGGTLPPKVTPVNATPIDPELAEFGREILEAGREGIVENIAEYGFDLEPDDPDLNRLKKGGKLFNLALKKKPEATEKIGSLGASWPGVIIFTILECLNVARECRRIRKKKGWDKEEEKKEPEPAKEPEKAPEPPKAAEPPPPPKTGKGKLRFKGGRFVEE